MFSTQFWMTLLKTNEMVMSSRVMARTCKGPAPLPPKTYNMQGQPENQSQQNEVSEQGCIHWLTTNYIEGQNLVHSEQQKVKF